MSDSITITKLKEKFAKDGKGLIHTVNFRSDDIAVIDKDEILPVLRFLKDDPSLKYNLFVDLTAVDYLKGKKISAANKALTPYLETGGYRFELVYHLYSTFKNQRIRIKIPLREDDLTINSVTLLYPGANWLERELWDLYGVKVLGHPNLKRILLYEGFEGHPLRKDYPKTKRAPLIGPIN